LAIGEVGLEKKKESLLHDVGHPLKPTETLDNFQEKMKVGEWIPHIGLI